MTDAGQIVLVVPGHIPDGPLVLSVMADAVSLTSTGEVLVQVDDIDDMVLDTIAALDHVDLIAVPDGSEPPAGITHQAAVTDLRKSIEGATL